jgi:hypothetical protein
VQPRNDMPSESHIASLNRGNFSQLVFCPKTPPSCETPTYAHCSRCPPMALGIRAMCSPRYQSLVPTHAPWRYKSVRLSYVESAAGARRKAGYSLVVCCVVRFRAFAV